MPPDMPPPPDPAVDPDAVADDDQLIEDLRAGAQPPSHDDVARHLAAWRDATSTATDPWIYRRLSDERLVDVPASTGRDPATTMLPAQTVRYGDAVDWARPPAEPSTGGYVYTDPAADHTWPRITDPVDDDTPDAFPPTWSGAPTERDQAAIDAGNA